MNIKFWQHKEKKEVVGNECYNKLPLYLRNYYIPTSSAPTHKVSDTTDGEGFPTILLAIDVVENIIYNNSNDIYFKDTLSPDFSGGDSGGAGATGDW
jgi:hypothetical protein